METEHFVGLSEFVSQILQDIKTGADASGVELESNKKLGGGSGTSFTEVTFDLVVTASKNGGTKTDGGVAVKVAGFFKAGADGQITCETKAETQNRIHFTIPVRLRKNTPKY